MESLKRARLASLRMVEKAWSSAAASKAVELARGFGTGYFTLFGSRGADAPLGFAKGGGAF